MARPSSGHMSGVRTSKSIKTVKSQMFRNPLREKKILFCEMKIRQISISHVIRDDIDKKEKSFNK